MKAAIPQLGITDTAVERVIHVRKRVARSGPEARLIRAALKTEFFLRCHLPAVFFHEPEMPTGLPDVVAVYIVQESTGADTRSTSSYRCSHSDTPWASYCIQHNYRRTRISSANAAARIAATSNRFEKPRSCIASRGQDGVYSHFCLPSSPFPVTLPPAWAQATRSEAQISKNQAGIGKARSQ